ncbi:Ig-like domain-containing protein [Schaalia sp. Marseille-Q2122]|uniref:Ig-like domain-containing protein n=1 Tax=Schaalia sp. Marseille-Q2122 TaxID=2736604 RepID=UPI00158C94C5|nr:Ig-like domain-containing protein [Schaalia sp. Marseille-Q2122]
MRKEALIKKMASLTTVVGVVSVVFAALLNPGQFSAKVDLNDGGVWVTNARLGLVGHLNYRAQALDSAIRTQSSSFDIYQNGEELHLADIENSTLSEVDVATATLTSSSSYPGMDVQAGANALAVIDAQAGRVWPQNLHKHTPFEPDEVAPAIAGMPSPTVSVGVDGTIHVASAQAQQLISLPPGAGADKAITREFPELPTNAQLSLTSVGSDAILFDRRSHTLYLPNGTTQTLQGTTFALQEPSAASDSVLLATDVALVSVPLDGAEPRTSAAHSVSGSPVKPVFHQGCSYGAWTGAGTFTRDCVDDSDDTLLSVDTLQRAKNTRFRVNRDVIVLNDTSSGTLWLPDHNMILIENWDDVHSQIENDTESEEDSVDDTKETILPERTEENTPPIAVDDEFGVRHGRTNILPVILNDSDPDGDFLTAEPLTQPAGAEVSIARYGAALQVRVDDGTSGTLSFDYRITDGRGGVAQAKVTLIVRKPEENKPPVQAIVPRVGVALKSSTVFNSLANWYDPDGDPFYLERVSAPEGLNVRQRETGTIDILESGHGPGTASIGLSVSDGREAGSGEIIVDITGIDNTPPVANVDHLIVRQGNTTVGRVLDNDTDANGDLLRIAQVSAPPAGIGVNWDGLEGTISVEGREVGTYYLTYLVSDGPSTAAGIVRVDVIDGNSDLRITAEDDFGVLPAGGHVLIDLLANDSDPAGGILTVQQLDVPATSSLMVALTHHQIVRVSAPAGLHSPQTFNYTVSNGVNSAGATVTIIPSDADNAQLGPELTPDRLTVRVGDVASVAVLDNDRSPSGLKLTVAPTLDHSIAPEIATVFTSNNLIRVRGGKTPGNGEIYYKVTDSYGKTATSVVHLTVIGPDEGDNTAPKPQDIIARTLAGNEVLINIPLDGIDPEGDSVTLVGLGTAPRLGTVTLEGTSFRYRAGDDTAGTDSFTYIVEDRLGLSATGRIHVGIAARPSTNLKPVAVPDLVRVRPGTRVAVDVVRNDTDPEGATVSLVPDSLTSPTLADTQASIRNGRILLSAPHSESRHTISYGIHDGAGGRAEGLLTVIVSEDAPRLAPIVRDDAVTREQVQAATDGTVSIDVRANDEDPDGDILDTTVTSADANLKANADGTVNVTLAAEPQILIYTLTDSDQLSASGLVRVPGMKVARPILDTQVRPVTVEAGKTVDIDINDYVSTREGRSVRLTSAEKVTVGIGANGDRLVKSPTVLTFTSRPDFSGQTSITFEVTDGDDVNDSEGRTAIINLPITVSAGQNRPPTIRPTAIELGAGEGGTTVDLAPMVTDPDNDDPASMTFSLGQVPAGISAALSGTALTVSAELDQAQGDAGALVITVDDGKGGSASGQFPIRVRPSSLPLMQISPATLTVNEGNEGSININDYLINPLAAKGPARIVGQPQVSEGGSATVNGETITVRPKAGFSGSFTIVYRLADASRDPAREVEGLLTVHVRGVPTAPSNVRVEAAEASAARVSWSASESRGTPILHYTVTDHAQGDVTECGLATSCLVRERTPGTEHRFSVNAHNEVGESPASEVVALAVDTTPEAPGTPRLVAGGGQVTVRWNPPRNAGSPIRSYEVDLSPHGVQTVHAVPGDMSEQSVTISGLQNGTQYVAKVRALNDQGVSKWSPESTPATPFGPPGPVTDLQVNYNDLGNAPQGASPILTIRWTAPAQINGRPIEYYTVTAGGVSKQVSAGEGTATTIQLPSFPTEQVTVTVTATNDRNQADTHTSAPTTVTTWVVGTPPPPSQVNATATGENNEIRVTWTNSPGGNGWRPADLSYEWSRGEGWYPLTQELLSHPSWVNGGRYTVMLRAVGTREGNTVVSDTSSSNEFSPYGPPIAPQISCEGGEKQVQCRWSGGDPNGRSAFFALQGPIEKDVDASGEQTYAVNPGESVRACVVVTQSESQRTATNCAEASAHPGPPDDDDDDDDDDETPGSWRMILTQDPGDSLSFTLTYDGAWRPGYRVISCFNARNRREANPSNYLGGPYRVFVGTKSDVRVRCAGNPANPSLRPNEHFSLRVVDLEGSEVNWVPLHR